MTEEFNNLTAADFKSIKDLTSGELIEEICHKQRVELEKMPIEHLRQVIIEYRVTAYRLRLIKESGLDTEEE